MKIVLFSSILAAFPFLIVGQMSREEGMKAIQSKLLDVPSAQYRLKASYNGRGYEFCNTSTASVVKFRLGCVKEKNRELTILSERRFEETELPTPAKHELSCQIWSSNHGFFPGEVCKKGKLAIIEVVLVDGARWKLKP